MKEIRSAAIVGMGALGLLYGTHIREHGGDVVYAMDSKRAERAKTQVFTKNGQVCAVDVVDFAHAQPVDLVIVAVKYTGLAEAVENMAPLVGESTVIVSVLNGIVSEDIIAARYGRDHLIETVAQGMDAMKAGTALNYTQMGKLFIGAKEPAEEENLERVCAYFDRIAMPYVKDPDIRYRMWCKLMLNVGINQTCMVYETDYAGALRPGEANRTLIAAMRETLAVGQAEGIAFGEKELSEYVEILKTLKPTGAPSMRQDGMARRKTEVDLFAGTIVDLAKKHGIYVPTNQYLLAQVHEMEAEF